MDGVKSSNYYFMLIQPNTLFLGRQFIHLNTVDNTMNHASALVAKSKPADGALVLADFQEAGRGQTGNSWTSEAAKNLTFSVVLFPSFLRVNEQFYLNMAVSLAVRAVAETLTGKTALVKWPNDILLGKKKVAGILITNTLRGGHLRTSIVGVGLNVNQVAFPPELKNATSLRNVAGKEFDRKSTLEVLCEKLEQYYLLLRSGKKALLKEEYLNCLYGWRRKLKFYRPDGTGFEAEITGVDESGLLCLNSGPAFRRYNFKEIIFDLG